MKYLDAHTHTHFAAFKDDWKEVIDRSLAAGVGLVNVGTQKDTSARAVEVANLYPTGVWATVGLHPIHTSKSFHDTEELGDSPEGKGFNSRGEHFDHETYLKLARDPKVVAIGECGLDYFRLPEEPDAVRLQREAFGRQITLAKAVGKPLMIHCRQAFDDLIDLLQGTRSQLNDPPGIIHFMSGSVEDARKLLDLGFYFTFGGVITFVKDYDKVVKFIPSDRLLSETDAPYVTPAPYRGKRNEPAYVVEVVKKLAGLKEVPAEEMAVRIIENARQVLRIPA